MSSHRIIQKLIVLASIVFSGAQAAVLNPGPYVFGPAGTERGEIIRQMPGARPAHRLHCEQGQCQKRVIGYMIRRNPEMEAAVQAALPHTETAASDALLEAARSASLGIAADGASTAIGVAAGATELNPLLGASPDPISLIAMGLLRHRMVNSALNDRNLSPEQKARTMCAHAGFSTGAAANNIAVLAAGGGVVPIIIGLLVGHAQNEACMDKVRAAQAWIEKRENQGLKVYAASLRQAQPNELDIAANASGKAQLHATQM